MMRISRKKASKEPDFFSVFEREYFIQTRKEIDTEKEERNKILNYAIISVGGICLVLSRINEPIKFLRSPDSLFLYFSLLLLISVLLVARRAKLRQIADRWFTLERMWGKSGKLGSWKPLEFVVCHGLRKKRYLSEDFWLFIGLCITPYLLIIWVAFSLVLMYKISLIACVFLHATVGGILLCRRVPESK